MDKVGHLLTHRLVRCGCPFSQGMHPSVNIGIVGLIIVFQDLQDLDRFLGGGCIVQINQRLVVNQLV